MTVTQDDLTTARQNFESHISGVMQEMAQTAQGENAKFSCGVTGHDPHGRRGAGDDAGVVRGPAGAGVRHRRRCCRRTWPASAPATPTCSATSRRTRANSTRPASPWPSTARRRRPRRRRPPWRTGSRSRPWPPGTTGGGPQGCDVLYGVSSQLGSDADLDKLARERVSQPISYNGSYLLVQITKLTPNDFDKVTSYVQAAVQQAGSTATSKAIQAKERRSDVSVDPRYGEWSSGVGADLHPLHAGDRRTCPTRRPTPSGSPPPPPTPSAGSRATAPPPHHRGGPRTGRHRPPGHPGGRAPGRRGAAVPAHGAAPGRSPVAGRAPPSTTSTSRAPPSTRCTPPSSRSWWRRPRPRPSRWSTRCRARRRWPSAPWSCCGPTTASRSRSCPPSPSWTWPGPPWASTHWRPASGWSTPPPSRRWPPASRARSWWPRPGRATCSRT